MSSFSAPPSFSWLRSLWPQPHERLIARRYLFRYRKSPALQVLALVLFAATAAIEGYYFLWPGQKTFTMGMVALRLAGL